MEKKVLNLVVSNKWYDMIASGEKNEEYRVIKAYWINRLVEAKSEDSEEYRKVRISPEFDIFISNAKLKELLGKKTARGGTDNQKNISRKLLINSDVEGMSRTIRSSYYKTSLANFLSQTGSCASGVLIIKKI